MKTYQRCLAGFAILLCACMMQAQAPNPQPLSTAEFNTLVDEYFDLYFSFHPSFATQAGFHQYDDKLEDYSAASVQREAAALRAFLPKLEKGRRAGLPRQSADELEFVESQIRGELLELETIRMWEKDPDPYASGPAYSLFLLMKRQFAPAEDRLRSVIAREKQIPAVLNAARHNLENPPKVYTEVALEQIPGTIEFFRHDVPAAFASVKDPKLLAEFRASNAQAVAALEKYGNFMRHDLMPVSRGEFQAGRRDLPEETAL